LLLAVPTIWRARREPQTRVLLAWALPLWLVYEAIPTKLLHYTLPAFPALALLVALHLPQALATAPRWLKAMAAVAVLPGLAPAAWALGQALEVGGAALVIIGLALALAGVALGLALWQAARARAMPVMLAAALAGAVLNAGLLSTLARLPGLWPSSEAVALAQATVAARGCDRPSLTGWGYTEPSLVWLGGRDTRLLPGDAPPEEALSQGPCAITLRRVSLKEEPEPAPVCGIVGEVQGLAIGAGRMVRLQLLDCGATP
jgi:4-amino-4-deoxy-L-arabinose transferase-like glycosyltransferase